ncbi:hypothetical protein [Flavihumibacter profundi]|jgi:hypothetical protein|uniref:hypothetical protein n=1 Tax=Flavihumibacter profundi TaxID=2716883 RepID=UPI001CC64F91|nr:hypothetical protein [Flavihumibacter profundi]MBZ5858450.1 hypothetical protein [Flavihumibacter profundi]
MILRINLVLVLSILLITQNCKAQNLMHYAADGQLLHSTHGTNYWGFSLSAERLVSPVTSLGIGAEYSYCSYHEDNGWNLTNLNFFPVYVQERFSLFPKSRLQPYIRLEEGVSFNNYNKELQNANEGIQHVYEAGIYGHMGIGIIWLKVKKTSCYLEAGLKSYNITFDNLDVNPHGFTARIGLTI